MITRIAAARQTPDWQREMAEAIRDPAELLARLGLDAGLLPAARAAARDFALKVPRAYVDRMQPGTPEDPLLRQVLPLAEELHSVPGYSADPVGDLAAMAAPGVLHKYDGRVLAIATGACAVHCRYCFRRAFPYADAQAGSDHWHDLLAYLHDHPDVNELILSGGDPLSLSDQRLSALLDRAEQIPHLRRVRIHTRLPVVIPARITQTLVRRLQSSPLSVVMVLHINHAQELDTNLTTALARLRAAHIHLLNQAVLLRGVNDNAQCLRALSEALFHAGVLPYYLHMLDAVQGAAHFAVPASEALALHDALNASLPGYLVPRLVREVPGAHSKSALIGV